MVREYITNHRDDIKCIVSNLNNIRNDEKNLKTPTILENNFCSSWCHTKLSNVAINTLKNLKLIFLFRL